MDADTDAADNEVLNPVSIEDLDDALRRESLPVITAGVGIDSAGQRSRPCSRR